MGFRIGEDVRKGTAGGEEAGGAGRQAGQEGEDEQVEVRGRPPFSFPSPTERALIVRATPCLSRSANLSASGHNGVPTPGQTAISLAPETARFEPPAGPSLREEVALALLLAADGS